MVILYDLIFLIVLLLHLPAYIFRRKFHPGFMRRLGVVPAAMRSLDRPVWVHAVSVGETVAARSLVKGLRGAYPGKKFIISTVTPTGNIIARSIAAEGDVVTYLPFDFSWIVRSVIRRVNPVAFIIVETELWPNLIMALRRQSVPVITVNGRISDRSYRGYRSICALLKPVLQAMALMCVQTDEDARRLRALGADPQKVCVTGNMKFDAVVSSPSNPGGDLQRIQALGMKLSQQLIVAGSTHPGEEEMLMRAFLKIRSDICGARLLIAPRHPGRVDAVIKMVAKFDFEAVRVSSLSVPATMTGRRVIYLLDTVGQLMKYYAFADVIFVGGSLVNTGGHNILEPASLGKPVVTGQHMFNFRDIQDLFVRNNAVRVVHDTDELHRVVVDILQKPEEAARLGAAALQVMRANSGAVDRTIEQIQALVRV